MLATMAIEIDTTYAPELLILRLTDARQSCHVIGGRRSDWPNALRSARWRRTAVVEIGGDEPAAVGAGS